MRNPEIPAKGYTLDFTFWTPHRGAGDTHVIPRYDAVFRNNRKLPAKAYSLDFTFWTPHRGAGDTYVIPRYDAESRKYPQKAIPSTSPFGPRITVRGDSPCHSAPRRGIQKYPQKAIPSTSPSGPRITVRGDSPCHSAPRRGIQRIPGQEYRQEILSSSKKKGHTVRAPSPYSKKLTPVFRYGATNRIIYKAMPRTKPRSRC